MAGPILNPYVPIVRRGNFYLFGNNRFTNIDENNQIELNDSQCEVFEKARNGKVEITELKEVLGEELVIKLMRQNILINDQVDVNSIFSRSKAYYNFNKMGGVHDVLQRKSVLILGCGGIGSHVAWNMVTMGVKRITLVDFDVVEESNLNRQLIYDMDDIGLFKVDILKEKLQKINPYIEIEALKLKVWSEQELDDIVLHSPCSLIVKALDTPATFPYWLDRICYKRKIPYVSGITANANPMIGPTYIPRESAGYGDFFDGSNDFQRVSGLSFSLGVLMFRLSGEVSLEAFKLLSGKGKLKYVNSIYIYDEMENTKLKLTPKNPPSNYIENSRSIQNFVCLFIVMFLSSIASVTALFQIIPFIIIFSILTPFLIYKTSEMLTKSAFINLMVSIPNMYIMLFNSSLSVELANFNIFAIVILLFLITSIIVLLSLTIVCILHYFISKRNFKLDSNKY